MSFTTLATQIIKGGDEKIMKRTKTLLTALAFADSLAGSAIAAEDGILSKVSAADENYRHMRFPAIYGKNIVGKQPSAQGFFVRRGD
jgi:hypothetical protein